MPKYTPEELKSDVEITYGCLGNEDDHLQEILVMIDENPYLKNQVETLKSLLKTVEEALRKETELRQQYQELADLSQEHFTHILRVNKIGYANQIAFKTEKEAIDFAKRHDLRGVTLSSIQFAEYGKYDDCSIKVSKE